MRPVSRFASSLQHIDIKQACTASVFLSICRLQHVGDKYGDVAMMSMLICNGLFDAAGACLPSCGVLPELPHHQPLPVAPIHGASYQRSSMLTAPPHSVHDVRQRCVPSSAAGLLSAPAGGQLCAGCRVLCWSPGMSCCSQEARCPVLWPQRLKHISGCWLQVARHTGNTIAFHMKNYGNFTQVGRHATQLTPAQCCNVRRHSSHCPVISMHATRIIPVLQQTQMHRG